MIIESAWHHVLNYILKKYEMMWSWYNNNVEKQETKKEKTNKYQAEEF